MINKKRLAMMAVAASMMLPTNLVYLSVATPVFATEVTGTKSGKITGDSIPDGFVWGSQTVGDESREVILLDSPEYSLESNITITKGTGDNDGSIVIEEGKTVTLKLNGNTLTSNASGVFKVYGGGNLVIEGPGTIECTGVDGSVIWTLGNNPNLTVKDGVILKADSSNGISAASSTQSGTITVENSSIQVKVGVGVYVQGKIYSNGPTINLTNTTITANTNTDALGIYQAGDSTINVYGGTITANCGIETRGGTLKINKNEAGEKAIINGGTGATTSKKSTLATNGSTTENAGIAIAQHVWGGNPDTSKIYPAITATIENATITGTTALAIVDPENNQNKEDPTPGTITVNVTDSTLTGSTSGFDVAYSTSIPFTLEDSPLTNGNIKKVKADASTGTLSLDETDTSPIPYTVISHLKEGEGIPADVVEKATTQNEEGKEVVNIDLTKANVPEIYKEISLDDLKDKDGNVSALNEETLGKILTQQSATKTILKDEEDPSSAVAPKYEFSVSNLTAMEASSDGITITGEPEIKVTLTEDSVLKLTFPTSAGPESGEIMIQLEDVEATNPSELYVEVKEDLKNSKSISAINTYLAKQKQAGELSEDFHVDTESLKVKELSPLTISGNAPMVKLNSNGFIEIPLAAGPAPTEGGGGGGTPHKPKPKPEEPTEPTTPATPTTMYRLYNKLTGEHLYTIDKNERDNLLTSDTWKDEGQGWIAPSTSDYPVYRLLNPNNGDHHYTIDKNEFDTLPTYGWVAEGLAFFSADKDNPENIILHRLYNPNAEGAGSHHYTADTNERDTLVAQGWKYEGTAWAGLPANK